MKSCVVLSSGGLDSSLICHLLHTQNIDVHPLYIKYGQINFHKEYKAFIGICKQIGLHNSELLDISDYGRLIPSGLTNPKLDIEKDAFLPGRNALFLLCAASYAHSQHIGHVAIGLLSEELSIFPDQTKKFISAMQHLIDISLPNSIKIVTPLAEFNKQDVIKLAKSENLFGTYSCHKGEDPPCGKCIACKEFIGG